MQTGNSSTMEEEFKAIEKATAAATSEVNRITRFMHH
jgi:hypothetical protein